MKKIFLLLAIIPSLLFGQGTGIIISNRASNGSIHIDTINRGSKFILKQTTASKTISIPNANTGATASKDFWIKNGGTVAVTLIPGGVLDTAQAIFYSWSGTKYAYSSAVSASGGSSDSADFLHKVNNLADLPNKTTARTNLGVAIGTNVQAFSSTLQSWASISPSLKQGASSNLDKWALLDTTYATVNRPGRLSQADWILFNSKQAGNSNLTKWSLKDTVYASSTRPGQLSLADWNTFNNKASSASVAAKRDSALAAGKIVVGQTYGGGLAVTPSGDATISNAGVVAIGAGKVTNSMLADADLSKWAALDTSAKYNASNPNGYFSKTPNTFGNAVTEDFVSIADWTNVGSGTFTVSGGVLTASGGDNTANNYLRYDGRGLSNLENYTIECDIIVGTINSSSWGLGVGWVRNSAYLPSQNNVAIYPILTTANGGKIKNVSIYNAGTAVKDSSAFGLTITAGDTLHLISTFNKDRYVTSVKNKRTSRTNDYIHVINQTVPVREVTPAAYDFTINIFGGTQKMMNFTVTANDIKSSNLLIIGHSISKGTTLESREYRYPDIISNLTTTTVTLNAGGSNRTNEINTTEALALTGQIVLIDLGLNDINNSKSVTQFGIDYRALVASFTGAGYVKGSTLFACNITPCSTITNFANIPNYNLVIDTIMGTNGVIDLYSMLNNSGALVFPGSTSDGVHPNKGAHYAIARAIIAKLNLKENNFATRVPQEKQHFVDAVGPQAHGSFDGSDRGWFLDNIDANTTAWMQGMRYNKQTQVYTAWVTTPTMVVQGTGLFVVYANTGATVGSAVTPTERFRINSSGQIIYPSTVTAAGTTGNQTINKPTGTVNIAASGTTVTVTNSCVTANSIIGLDLRTNDATAWIKNCVPSAGSFIITLGAAATAEISIGFDVKN